MSEKFINSVKSGLGNIFIKIIIDVGFTCTWKKGIVLQWGSCFKECLETFLNSKNDNENIHWRHYTSMHCHFFWFLSFHQIQSPAKETRLRDVGHRLWLTQKPLCGLSFPQGDMHPIWTQEESVTPVEVKTPEDILCKHLNEEDLMEKIVWRPEGLHRQKLYHLTPL